MLGWDNSHEDAVVNAMMAMKQALLLAHRKLDQPLFLQIGKQDKELVREAKIMGGKFDNDDLV